jgi:ligand-binding sensor protein
MTLSDILSKEEWAAFEKALFERFKINCTVYNTDGIGVTGKPNWCNRLCPEIKGNRDSLAAICAPGNQNFMARAEKTREPVIDECDAGMMKIAVPIFNENEFLGTAGGCGLLPAGGEVETFLIEKTAGLTEKEIADLSEGMGTMTEAQAQEMASFIQEKIKAFMNNREK